MSRGFSKLSNLAKKFIFLFPETIIPKEVER